MKIVHQMTPNWPWSVQGQRYTTLVLLVTPSLIFFSPLCSTPSRFQDIARFIIFHWLQCYTAKKKKKKNQKKKKKRKEKKFKNLTSVETLSRSIHDFLEQIWLMLWEKMSFETFTPIWSHVNENDLHRGMRDFWQWIYCVFSEEMSFEIFPPISSDVRENEK